jgi:hypothetical protein
MAVRPWPGYEDLSESRRKELLEFKIDDALLRWDLLYAHAVASAVANYEALQRGDGVQPNDVERAADQKFDEIEEAGGWRHG